MDDRKALFPYRWNRFHDSGSLRDLLFFDPRAWTWRRLAGHFHISVVPGIPYGDLMPLNLLSVDCPPHDPTLLELSRICDLHVDPRSSVRVRPDRFGFAFTFRRRAARYIVQR